MYMNMRAIVKVYYSYDNQYNKVMFTNDGIKKEKVILAYRYTNG